MSSANFDFSAIPQARVPDYSEFARAMAEQAGQDLLALVAYGGWVVGDRCFERAPAQSVLVLRQLDLRMLDRMAPHGRRLGRKNVAAPLVMTPEYIRSSCDAFPLEFLEIQQLHGRVTGDDYFGGLTFEPRDLRLQCERELKSILIHMRQGLVAATGRRDPLDDVCALAAERAVRILRGILQLKGHAAPQLAMDVMTATAAATDLKLVTLARALAGTHGLDFDGFARCYGEVEKLAEYADALGESVQRK